MAKAIFTLPNSAVITADEVAVAVQAAFEADRHVIAAAKQRDDAMFAAIAKLVALANEVGYVGAFATKRKSKTAPKWTVNAKLGITVSSADVEKMLVSKGVSAWAAKRMLSATRCVLERSSKVRGEAGNPKASEKLIRDNFPAFNTLKGIQDYVSSLREKQGRKQVEPKASDGAGAEGTNANGAPAKVAEGDKPAQEPKAATKPAQEPKAPMGDLKAMSDGELEAEILAMVAELASRPKGAKRIAMIGQQVETLLEAQAQPKAA